MELDYEFLKDVILVLIPLVGGVMTVGQLRKSWQETHEKNRIKKEILEEYKETLPKSYSLIVDIQYTVAEYYSGKQYIESADNCISKRKLKFPTDPLELPREKFSKEYNEFFKEYWKLNYANNKFLTTLRLYYGDKDLEEQFNSIRHRLGTLYLLMKELIEAETSDEFFKNFQSIDVRLQETSDLMDGFEESIIAKKIIIK